MKKVNTELLVRLCLPQFAVGLFTTMLNNYLIYFYQPSKASGIPNLIPQGRIVLGVLTIIGLIKAVGHIIDAVTDPLIASKSDKSKNKNGRRIPLMQKAAIPFGLSALLMFVVPFNTVSGWNAVWIAIFMWGYYFFFTLYMIPHTALIPELVQDGKMRVNAYTISSLFFVTGSALGYVTPLIVNGFKSAGVQTLSAWRATFGIYTVIGIVLLLIPAFTIKEKDYVHSVIPNITLKESLQACIMYYVTELMGLPEENSVLILAISIAGSLLMYPFVNKFAKKKGKKLPIILGCIVFSIAEIVICFSDMLTGNKLILACIFALFVSFPFAVLNVLPNAMMADIIQYDTVTSGVNQEGIFGAAKSFIVKMGNSLAIMIVPSLVVIGAAAGENVGKLGLKLTAVAGGVFCLLAIIVLTFYKEKEVLDTIKAAGGKKENISE